MRQKKLPGIAFAGRFIEKLENISNLKIGDQHEKNNLLRYWPLSLILAGIALIAVLVVSSTQAQAISSHKSSALQETQPAVTVPAPTVVIPVTEGGDTIIIDFFSSWVFWAIIGLLVVVFLFALVIRPRSTPDIHHHHDV